MIRPLIRFGATAMLVGLVGCDLVVENPNQPETARVLKTPADVEALLGTQYLRWHIAMHGSLSNVWGMALVQSFENFSSLANNCMGARVGIPRGANENAIGNGCATEQRRVYFIESEVARTTSNILNRLNDPAFTLGSQAQDARARAFAEFIRGLALGYLALTYDSAAVVVPGQDAEDPGELTGYKEVMTEALSALQKAIDAASLTPAGANGWPLPSSWIPSPSTFTSAEFIRLVKSYRARLRAGVARNPAERAAVNWDAVIADAQGGITADFINNTNITNGPFNTWISQLGTFTTWHQMTPFVIGMADNTGAYAAWLAQPIDERGAGGPFFMRTPDLRFPQGADRPAQQADFAITSCSTAGSTCKRYFRNRPTAQDQTSGASWGWSNYDFVRFYPWRTAGDAGTGGQGVFPFFTKAELDLLEAEGHFRKGNYAAAAALVNKTRTARGGLPAITQFDATSPVPGGTDCVPKVPVGPSFTNVACGNLFEAMKWEKRVETMFTHFMAWFQDMRGWGDLPEGTGIHWAVPFEDLQARGRSGSAIYSTGGINSGAAPKGTYGW